MLNTIFRIFGIQQDPVSGEDPKPETSETQDPKPVSGVSTLDVEPAPRHNRALGNVPAPSMSAELTLERASGIMSSMSVQELAELATEVFFAYRCEKEMSRAARKAAPHAPDDTCDELLDAEVEHERRARIIWHSPLFQAMAGELSNRFGLRFEKYGQYAYFVSDPNSAKPVINNALTIYAQNRYPIAGVWGGRPSARTALETFEMYGIDRCFEGCEDLLAKFYELYGDSCN